jgi:hypothetical protein
VRRCSWLPRRDGAQLAATHPASVSPAAADPKAAYEYWKVDAIVIDLANIEEIPCFAVSI